MNRIDIPTANAWKKLLTERQTKEWLTNNIGKQVSLRTSDYARPGYSDREEALIYLGHLMGPMKAPTSIRITIGEGWHTVSIMIPNDDALKSFDEYDNINNSVIVFIDDDILAVQFKLMFNGFEPQDDYDDIF